MAKKQARRTASEIDRVLRKLDASGLTKREFAAREGIPNSTLYLWSRKRKSASDGAKRLRRVERSETTRSSGWFEIGLPSGVLLKLPVTVSQEELERIMRALVSCSG